MARQKTVFTDKSEVSHLWAHRAQDSARYAKDNFFFTGAALYSYGSHYLCGFMIGRDIAFLNSDRYSVTTSGHQSLAASATRHLTQYHMPDLTALYDVLLLADAEGSPAKKRKLAKGYERAAKEGNLGAINYAGSRELRAYQKLREWLAANPAAARDSAADGVAFLAARIGMSAGEVTSAIREGERKAKAKEDAAAKRETERLDREGKRFAAMSFADILADSPEDGRDYYGRRDSKPYALKKMEDFAKELGRYHKRAKAAGYSRRAAALWSHVKAYRAHIAGRNDRIIAAHRRERARELVELLLIFSPAYAKEIGAAWPRSAKAEAREHLESDAKLWGAWAWGNVYGFVIESLDSDGDPDGDCLDSCFGFYGDPDESGLAEAAAESLAYIRKERRERRLAKLKEFIRARVPLAARAAILEGFPL